MKYKPIESYGVIGDLHTVALVGMDGSIDFMSFPRFDSPTIFGALLDPEKGGHFKISPVMTGTRSKQFYMPDSVVLLTRFFARQGVAELSDFMSIQELDHQHNLVRRAKAARGDIDFELELTDRLAAGLRARGAEILSPLGIGERSGILVFRPKIDPHQLCANLVAKGFIVRVRVANERLGIWLERARRSTSRTHRCPARRRTTRTGYRRRMAQKR